VKIGRRSRRWRIHGTRWRLRSTWNACHDRVVRAHAKPVETAGHNSNRTHNMSPPSSPSIQRPCTIVIARTRTSPQSNLRRARRKGPIGYNGTLKIHPQNCPFSFHDHHHLIHPYQARPTHHPKQHPDPISHFATIHFPDTLTDRQIDRQMV